MKRIVKSFNDFSYIKEDLENVADDVIDSVDNDSNSNLEEEESPLSQLSEESGLSIERDGKGDFIKTGDGDVIRYFSETGYYNETKKKKYGDEISDFINLIKPVKVTESRRNKVCRSERDCNKSQCDCKSKRRK